MKITNLIFDLSRQGQNLKMSLANFRVSSAFLQKSINSLPARECPLQITFAKKLDPDQARQNVGPDLDTN